MAIIEQCQRDRGGNHRPVVLLALGNRVFFQANEISRTPFRIVAGLWVFLSMLEVLEAYSLEELDGLKQTAQKFLGKENKIV